MAPTGAAGAADVPGLLAALQHSDPGCPRVTWYGADGERIELSARVLANWVAKTANLLVDELDAAGSTVRLALPGHWKSVVWALATWSVGARLVEGAAHVLVTDRPTEHPRVHGTEIVAVALPSLARRFEGALPPGVLDYAAEVAGFDDVLAPVGRLDHRVLLAAARAAGVPQGARVLVDAGAPYAVLQVLAALVVDGSAVLAGRELSPHERATELLTG